MYILSVFYRLHGKLLLDLDEHQQCCITILSSWNLKIFMQCIIFSKFSVEFHRNNGSKKCGYPVYEEDCQYICDCNKNDCHFVTGCSQHVTTVTDHHQPSTYALRWFFASWYWLSQRSENQTVTYTFAN